MADNIYRLKLQMSDDSEIDAGTFTVPQGEPGAAGATGAKGDTGPKGDTGEAGVSVTGATITEVS